MYTLTTRGYPVVTLYGAEPVNQFGDHFAPIYYLLAPLYAAFSGAATLLVVQSIALGLGAIPVYLLTRDKIGSASLAAALAAAYLLYPALHAVNTFDFHEIALVTPLLLFSLYFLEVQRRGPFLVFLALAMLTKEEVALSAAAIGLYVLLIKRQRRLGSAVLIASLAYFFLVNQVIMPALGGGPDLGRFAGVAAAGQTGFGAILLGILTNPIYAFSQAFLDGQKMTFMAQLLLPVVFLPLLAGGAWLMAVPAFATALLASTSSQYSLTYHYAAIITPFVFVLAVLGLQRLNRRTYDRVALAAAILVIGLAMNYAYGWVGGKRAQQFQRADRHDQTLAELIAQIPHQAAVSTLSDIVPHLSNRDAIYLFPVVADADIILFDSDPGANFWPFTSHAARGEAQNALMPYLVSGAYGLARSADGALLLQRGYDAGRNNQAIRDLLSLRFEAEGLATDLPGLDLADPQAGNGRARVARPSMLAADRGRGLTFGPYVTLPPGQYQIIYRLKHGGTDVQGAVATVDVYSSSAGGVLASRDIHVADFSAPDQYQDFILDLDLRQDYDDLEFRILYQGLGDLWADSIVAEPVQAPVTVLDVASPGPPSGQTGEAGDRVLAQAGPLALIPGVYRAMFTLTPPVGISGSAGPAAKLEVVSATAGGPLAEWTLSGHDFAVDGQPQPFTLDFRTDQLWPDVVLRAVARNGETPQAGRIALQYIYQGKDHGDQ